MTSTIVGIAGLLMGAISMLTGAGGLTFLERALERPRGRPARIAALVIGAVAVAFAVITLRHACRLIQAAARLA